MRTLQQNPSKCSQRPVTIIVTIVWIILVATTFFRLPSSREPVDTILSNDAMRFQDPNTSQAGGGGSGEAGSSAELEKEFEKVAEEIRMRLDHEHDLFLYQFILVGAVFGIVFHRSILPKKTPSDDSTGRENTRKWQSGGNTIIEILYENGSLFLAFGVIAVALLVVDIHIRFNALAMQSLGDWIRGHYERRVVLPAIGWELFWSSDQNRNFRNFDSFLYMMLYLPTIGTLLGFYAMLFRQQKSERQAFRFLSRGVFAGVQMGVFLFAVINRWPLLSMPLGDWFITLVWLLLWIIVGWWGWSARVTITPRKGKEDHPNARP